MVVVVALGREQEGAELASVESAAFTRVDLRSADVLSRVGTDPPVDMGEAVEPADRRQSPVDGRRGESSLLACRSPQLDVGTLSLEDLQANARAPLEVAAKVVAVSLERPTAVTG